MFMMWYAAQQQLKKIDIASNNGISIADDNDDRYTSTMTIYYADDTIVTYDNAIAKVPLALMDDWRHCNNIQLQQSTDGIYAAAHGLKTNIVCDRYSWIIRIEQ